MPKITSEMLLEADACDFFQEKFESDFPDGLDFDPADRRLLARLVEMGYGSVLGWPEDELGIEFAILARDFPPLRIGDLDDGGREAAMGYAVSDILYDDWQEDIVDNVIEAVKPLGIRISDSRVADNNEVAFAADVDLLTLASPETPGRWPEWLNDRVERAAFEKAVTELLDFRPLIEEAARLSFLGGAYVSFSLVEYRGYLGSGIRTDLAVAETRQLALYKNVEEAIWNDAEEAVRNAPEEDEEAIWNNAEVVIDSVYEQVNTIQGLALDCMSALTSAVRSHLNELEQMESEYERACQWAKENDVWFNYNGEPIGYGPAVMEAYINGN